MRLVVSNAGANRAALILDRSGALVVESTLSVDPDVVELGRVPLEQRADLPQAIIHSVARSAEPVVIGDATRDPRFAADPYVAAHRPRSVLCLPLVYQGQLTGILYLENSLALHAFGEDGIELLSLLSSHAAVAVQNALLYARIHEAGEALRAAKDRLEHEVAERTEALREANLRLEAHAAELSALNERLRHELLRRQIGCTVGRCGS